LVALCSSFHLVHTAGKQQFHVETQWQEYDLLQNFTLEESPAIGEAKCFNWSPKDLWRRNYVTDTTRKT
jgi:hypothetical protein